jgi:nucleotide-binding universal stress UspA family protein
MRMAKWERVLMFSTFLIMVCIEVTLFATKPGARIFTMTILTLGLILRGIASERAQKKKADEEAKLAAANGAGHSAVDLIPHFSPVDLEGSPMLCAVRGTGRTLDFAVDEACETGRPLYLLFVREQPMVTPSDQQRKWTNDPDALAIFQAAWARGKGHPIFPCYAVSDSAADTIVDTAATLGVSRLVLGSTQRNSVAWILRGDMIRKVSNLLPENIHLLICA